ncbi:ATP-binding cassette domain-containing protein [Alicyclobacillus herbarius]|uniref:ATP-binding cassette domain-containing protein n=1 Tax=Alicyclobacillus herbarius TaxID=122960 RepID=UPI0003F7B161|nr:ATP-binding cassette domain-containing protein [Alicyclobacillus herbarius]
MQLSYRIGTVFGQKSQLWYHLPPRDTFDLMASIYDLPKTEYRRRRDELVERFQLSALMDTPVRRLSLGERMRCEIAVSFLHRPRILFLDEPTIGLDVVVKQTIRELIRDLNQQEDVTVFLTSHDATDVESLCRRVLVINQGRLLFDGPTTQLVNRFLHYKEVHLQLQEPDFDLACEGVEVQTLEPARIKLVVEVRGRISHCRLQPVGVCRGTTGAEHFPRRHHVRVLGTMVHDLRSRWAPDHRRV